MNTIAMQPVNYETALNLILQNSDKIRTGSEFIGLNKACGRVLAQDVVSDLNLPAADCSAMDGFCLKAASLKGASLAEPVTLPVAPGIDAGHTISELPEGHCAYIATGGILPPGADTVVRVEDTKASSDGKTVSFHAEYPRGNYVRGQSSELSRGDLMLQAPLLITPQAAGRIASAGLSNIAVRKKPIVAILISGDEVLMPFELPHPWQVRNSNSTMLIMQAEEAGAQILDFGIARDRGNSARDLFLRAVEAADIVVTSGGISMGRHDPFKAVLSELAVEPVFYGVDIKPGKPMFFGFYNTRAIFALPGNQVSTSVTFELFVRPFIRKVIGAQPTRLTLDLELTESTINKEKRDFFKRGTLVSQAGRTMVKPLPTQESHMLTSFSGADLLFLHPAGSEKLESGEKVRCFYLKG